MPGPGAVQDLSRPIDLPDGAALPAEGAADRLDHARRRVFERWRFRQCAGDFEENLLLAGHVSGGSSPRIFVHEYLGFDTVAALHYACDGFTTRNQPPHPGR
jgi:hypothetical protein